MLFNAESHHLFFEAHIRLPILYNLLRIIAFKDKFNGQLEG